MRGGEREGHNVNGLKISMMERGIRAIDGDGGDLTRDRLRWGMVVCANK